MRQAKIVFFAAILTTAISACLYSSCSPPTPPDTSDTSKGSGSSLVRYGKRLYLLGGLDAEGNPVSAVRSAEVSSDGSMGPFRSEPELPQGLAYTGAAASDSRMYCIGGETESGIPVSAIRYTYVDSEGALGFGPGVTWESNPLSLPEPRSRAAVLIHDGWLYLIGGLADGGVPSDLILRARVYQDGQVGSWYPAARLSSPRSRAAATILGDKLYVAGGYGGSATGALCDVVSFALGPYGSLGAREAEPALPEKRSGGILIADGECLVSAGGYDENGKSTDSVYRFSGGAWTRQEGLSISADGPSAGRAAGALFYLPQGFVNDGDQAINMPEKSEALELPPESPEALPGSGRVPDNCALRFLPEPGASLRYEKNGAPVTSASPEYSIASPPKASTTAIPAVDSISLKAFGLNGKDSPEIRYDFLPGNIGFFVTISDTVEADIASPGFAGYLDRAMRESTTDVATYPDGYMPSTSERFRLVIRESGAYYFRIADAETNAATGKSYTGRISFSLVERDLITEVPDSSGVKITDIGASSDSIIEMWLQSGSYYLRAVDKDGIAGRTFGLSVSRR